MKYRAMRLIKRFIKPKRAVTYFWLIAYALLLIIPIFGNLGMLAYINNSVREENRVKHTYFLNSLKMNLDYNLNEINLAMRVTSENEVILNMAENVNVDVNVIYNMSQTGKEINGMMGMFENISGIFVFYPQIDRVISAGEFFKTEEFIELHETSGGHSLEYYRQILNENHSVLVKDKQIYESGEVKTVYRFFTPVEQNGRTQYTICIEMDEKKLFGNDIDFSKESVAVLKKRNNVYFSTCKIQKDDLSILKKTDEYISKNMHINGRRAAVSYIKSDIFGYKYVYIDHVMSLYDVANKVLVTGVAVSLVCVLIMIIILYRLYSWNYLNIKNLMHSLDEVVDDDNCVGNEYEVIQNKILIAMRQKRATDKENNKRTEMLKNEFLSSVLHGTGGTVEYVRDILEKYDIRFKGEYFIITMLRIKDTGILRGENLQNVHYIINNIMDDVLQKESYCRVECDGMLYYIFSLTHEENVKRHYSGILHDSCEVIKLATEIVLATATSEIGFGIDSLPKLFEKVNDLMNLGEFYGLEDHIFKEDIDSKNKGMPHLTHLENGIILSIKSGSCEQLYDAVEKLFEGNIHENYRWTIIGFVYSILSSIYKIIENTDSDAAVNASKMLNSFHEYDNIEKMKSFVYSYGCYAISVSSSESKEKDGLYGRAVAYINENYHDKDLNVAKVSEKLGVTSIYLAYIAKQNSGERLSEYISKLRIEKAKELLKTKPELRVEEVAEESGFYQNRTFYSTFKKYTGLTPSNYRIINQKNGGK